MEVAGQRCEVYDDDHHHHHESNYIDIRATVSNCPTITETARSNDKYIVLSLRCPTMYGVSGKEAMLSIISFTR